MFKCHMCQFTQSSSFSVPCAGQDNFLRTPIECLRVTGDFEGDAGDVIEAHEWKCVRTVNGGIIFFLKLID